MTLETTHNDVKIEYRESNDTWEARELDLSAPTLSALRTKINAAMAASRRLDNPAAFVVGHYGEAVPTSLNLIDKDMKSVWCFTAEGAGNRKSIRRHKEVFNRIALDTPEVRAAIKRWQDAKKAEDDARHAQRAAREAIPTVTLEQLRALSTPEQEDAA